MELSTELYFSYQYYWAQMGGTETPSIVGRHCGSMKTEILRNIYTLLKCT